MGFVGFLTDLCFDWGIFFGLACSLQMASSRFMRGMTKNSDAVRRALSFFCNLSVQKINKEKPKSYFSANAVLLRRSEIKLRVKLKLVERLILERYLGFPLDASPGNC